MTRTARVHGCASLPYVRLRRGRFPRKETLMEELFVRPRALMRMREGPLGVCIDTFID